MLFLPYLLLEKCKSYPLRNPLVILDLTSDLSFKVIGDFQGQSYTKHATPGLLLPAETQYVLPSYRTSWSRNPLVILDSYKFGRYVVS